MDVTTLVSTAHDAVTALAVPVEVPNPGDGAAPPGVGDKFEEVMGWAKWVCLGISVLGIMAIGAMMGLGSRRGEGGDRIGALGWAMAGVVVIAGAFTLVGFLATS